MVISVVPSSSGNLHVPTKSKTTPDVPYTQYITNEPQMSLKRELTPSSSIIVSPQQPPAIKIQKLPLPQGPNQVILNCTTFTNEKTNGAGHVQTQTIGPNTSALAGEHSKKPSNVLILPSSDSYTQSSAQLFETSTSSQKLKKIGRLNDALMDINPRWLSQYFKHMILFILTKAYE